MVANAFSSNKGELSKVEANEFGYSKGEMATYHRQMIQQSELSEMYYW